MITADPEQAAEAVARGEAVVLLVAPGSEARRPAAPRMAVMVGDPDDPAVWAAAGQMHDELFAR